MSSSGTRNLRASDRRARRLAPSRGRIPLGLPRPELGHSVPAGAANGGPKRLHAVGDDLCDLRGSGRIEMGTVVAEARHASVARNIAERGHEPRPHANCVQIAHNICAICTFFSAQHSSPQPSLRLLDPSLARPDQPEDLLDAAADDRIRKSDQKIGSEKSDQKSDQKNLVHAKHSSKCRTITSFVFGITETSIGPGHRGMVAEKESVDHRDS